MAVINTVSLSMGACVVEDVDSLALESPCGAVDEADPVVHPPISQLLWAGGGGQRKRERVREGMRVRVREGMSAHDTRQARKTTTKITKDNKAQA